MYSNLISSILCASHFKDINAFSVQFRYLRIHHDTDRRFQWFNTTPELASADELNKSKIIAQPSFTRSFNCLYKLLDSGSPTAVLNKTIEEYEAKYKVLPERCEAILMSSEPDPKVEDFLTDKYDKLND